MRIHVDFDSGRIFTRDKVEYQDFGHCRLTFLLRLNSLQIIMLCWDEDIDDDFLRQNKDLLEIQYPYSILDEEGQTQLSRCTSEFTYPIDKVIDVTWGQKIMDDISEMRGTFTETYQDFLKKEEEDWKIKESELARSHPRDKK